MRYVSDDTQRDLRHLPPTDDLRTALLALHKALLAAERQSVERVHGRLSNAEYLQIVQDPLRYGWLKPFTELILAFDDEEPGDLVERTKELLVPPKQKTPFGRRYLSLMQREPALVLAHRDLLREI